MGESPPQPLIPTRGHFLPGWRMQSKLTPGRTQPFPPVICPRLLGLVRILALPMWITPRAARNSFRVSSFPSLLRDKAKPTASCPLCPQGLRSFTATAYELSLSPAFLKACELSLSPSFLKGCFHMQKYMFVDVTEGREQLLSLPPLFLKGIWDSQKHDWRFPSRYTHTHTHTHTHTQRQVNFGRLCPLMH